MIFALELFFLFFFFESLIDIRVIEIRFEWHWIVNCTFETMFNDDTNLSLNKKNNLYFVHF